MRFCAIKSCKSRKGDGSSLFSLPDDSESRKLWLKFINLEGGTKVHGVETFVCHLHFEESKIKVFPKRRTVDKLAYPTIGSAGKIYSFEEINSSEIFTESVATHDDLVPQTFHHQKIVVLSDEKISNNHNVISSLFDGIRDSKLQIQHLSSSLEMTKQQEQFWKGRYENKSKQLDVLKKNLSQYFGPSQMEIFEGKSRNNIRWDDDTMEKMAILKENVGDRNLKLLNEQFFPTPHPSTIRQNFKDFTFEPGSQKVCMRALKRRGEILNLAEHEKKIVIGFDEKHIVPGLKFNPAQKKIEGIATLEPSQRQLIKNPEKIASQGQLYLAMGLYPRFKEIIGYDLTTNSTDPESMMKRLFDLIIETELETGMEVLAIVMDMGPSNLSFLKHIGIKFSKTNPTFFIPHPANPSRKLFIILDPVHILKNLASGLRHHQVKFSQTLVNNFQLSSSIADIEDIKGVYELQANQEIKLAPHLTSEVISPSHFETMREDIAYKLFSPEVSKALDIIFKNVQGKNPTAFYLENLNRFKEICTNQSGWETSRMSDYESDLQFLKFLANDFFPNIHFDMKRGSLKSLEGAILTCFSIISLSVEMFECGAEKFIPRHVLNNAVENKFSQLTYRYQKPDAGQFARALKSNSIKNFDKPVKGSSYHFDSPSSTSQSINFKKIIQEVATESKTSKEEDEIFEIPTIDLPASISDVELFPSLVNRTAFHENIFKIIDKNISLIDCEECLEKIQSIPLEDDTYMLTQASLNFFCLLELCYRQVKSKMSLIDSNFKSTFITNAIGIAELNHCPNIQDLLIEQFFNFRFPLSMDPRQKHNVNKHASKSLSK